MKKFQFPDQNNQRVNYKRLSSANGTRIKIQDNDYEGSSGFDNYESSHLLTNFVPKSNTFFIQKYKTETEFTNNNQKNDITQRENANIINTNNQLQNETSQTTINCANQNEDTTKDKINNSSSQTTQINIQGQNQQQNQVQKTTSSSARPATAVLGKSYQMLVQRKLENHLLQKRIDELQYGSPSSIKNSQNQNVQEIEKIVAKIQRKYKEEFNIATAGGKTIANTTSTNASGNGDSNKENKSQNNTSFTRKFNRFKKEWDQNQKNAQQKENRILQQQFQKIREQNSNNFEQDKSELEEITDQIFKQQTNFKDLSEDEIIQQQYVEIAKEIVQRPQTSNLICNNNYTTRTGTSHNNDKIQNYAIFNCTQTGFNFKLKNKRNSNQNPLEVNQIKERQIVAIAAAAKQTQIMPFSRTLKKVVGTENNILFTKQQQEKLLMQQNQNNTQRDQNNVINKQLLVKQCSQEQAPSYQFKKPNYLDQYKLGNIIGQGSYAIVRLALNTQDNMKKVAIKTYEKIKLFDPQKRKNVKREIGILKQMNHVNIIKLNQIIETNRSINLVFEFLSTTTMHQYLKTKNNRRLEEQEAKKIFSQVVQGISYCHNNNVIHRDIKLENILIDENKKIKIIDFGFSIQIALDHKLSIFCGTPTYMAPEIVARKDYLGQYVDIWALGIFLFIILCGKFPFKGQDDKSLYRKILRGQYDAPAHLSEGAKKLIAKILKINPQERPTCEQILKDDWLNSYTTSQY